MIASKDKAQKETEEWDLKTGITVASVWVAAPVRDLIGNDTLLF